MTTLLGMTDAFAHDWPVQGPCDDQCMEPYVRMEVHTPTRRRALNDGTSIMLWGLACYDAFPRDTFCDPYYEGRWSAGWSQRTAVVEHVHQPFGSTNPNFQTIQTTYQPQSAGGVQYVTWAVSRPVEVGYNVYRGVPDASSIERVRVDTLNDYTMPTVPVRFNWSFTTDSAIDAMNHRPSGETRGLPEGFSFAQLVRGQSMVEFFLITENSGIAFCNDESWPTEYACPTPSQSLIIEDGNTDDPLGDTAYNQLPFPFTTAQIGSTVPSVYIRAIAAYVQANFCVESHPIQCRNRNLYATDDLLSRIDDVAYMIGTTAAHEAGHAVGLVPNELFGGGGGHVSENVPTYDADASGPIMAAHAQDTGGFGVVRDEDGSRIAYRTRVGWSWANWEYLIYGR